ncbi:MAG: ABC transporter ATP-binding protein [Erysipelothrix sp.]|nr:ABC transporter ATP-binding protein [Erysipelothrix sp.]
MSLYRKLLKSVREYKKPSLQTPMFVAFEVAIEVGIPFLMASLIDLGIDDGNLNVILKLGLILLLGALLKIIFGALAGRSAARASAGFAKNLRHDIFYKIQDFSFSNLDKYSTSSVITRVTTDITNIQHSYQMVMRMASRAPMMLTFSLFAAFQINHRLSLIFLVIIPILGTGLYFIVVNAHPIFRRVFRTYDKLNRVVQENLHGIRVVKSFVREDYEVEKFSDISQEIHDDFVKAEKILSFNMPLMQLSVYSAIILLAWFGARLIVLSGSDPVAGLTTGQLMSLITYTMQILMSLMMLSFVLVMIVISRASVERVVEILSETSDLVSPNQGITHLEDGSIEFKNVSFEYHVESAKKVLDNINFKIESGATVGVIGGTGSSKTSLVQLIPRLYDATEGEIRVGNHNVKNYDLKTLRDQVAMVLQKNVLFAGTIKENLRWGDADASDAELIAAAKIAQAHNFIMSFPDGYDHMIEQGGTNVSGGQKQRLTIARALLKQPKILILDDSTSAIDMKTDAQLREAFANDIPNTTKIIIAQRIESIKDADFIIVMDDGKIDGLGNHDELLANNLIYQEVYYSQQKGDA